MSKIYNSAGSAIETVKNFVLSNFMGRQPKWETQGSEKTYKDMKAGYAEYEASRRDDSLLFMNRPRIIVNEKGEETLSLWAYGKLPLRLMSDVVGFLANTTLPIFLREPLFSAFGSAFGVDMSEAAEEDYRFYPTFNAFFRRALKPGMRPISEAPLVSPADGKVLHVSKCESGYVEQVKGLVFVKKKMVPNSNYFRCQLFNTSISRP